MAAKKPKDAKPKPPKDAGDGKPKAAKGGGGGGCGPLAWLGLLLVLGLAYVLSVFLVVWLTKHNYLANGVRPSIDFVYRPLSWAYNEVHWVKAAYDWGFRMLGLT